MADPSRAHGLKVKRDAMLTREPNPTVAWITTALLASCGGAETPEPPPLGPEPAESLNEPSPDEAAERPSPTIDDPAEAELPTELETPELLEPDPATEAEAPPAVQECATTRVESEVSQVRLLFLVDTSISLGFNRFVPTRWEPMKAGLAAFFSDPASMGLQVSMKAFPDINDPINLPACRAASYVEPDIAWLELPETQRATAYLERLDPRGNTPTTPAIEGGLQLLEQQLAEDPEARVALVLVTDGIPSPDDCSLSSDFENTVDGASAAVTAAAERIPTFVIGVGDGLEDLNQLAVAGGTREAVIIDPVDPEATRDAISTRLAEIGSAIRSCDLVIPDPPAGQVLEIGKVAAELEDASGAQRQLAWSQDCSDPQGFQYDSPENPTRLTLCDSACADVQASDTDPNIVFGCLFEPPTAR